jgi:hypothetical protein
MSTHIVADGLELGNLVVLGADLLLLDAHLLLFGPHLALLGPQLTVPGASLLTCCNHLALHIRDLPVGERGRQPDTQAKHLGIGMCGFLLAHTHNLLLEVLDPGALAIEL